MIRIVALTRARGGGDDGGVDHRGDAFLHLVLPNPSHSHIYKPSGTMARAVTVTLDCSYG